MDAKKQAYQHLALSGTFDWRKSRVGGSSRCPMGRIQPYISTFNHERIFLEARYRSNSTVEPFPEYELLERRKHYYNSS